MMKVIQNVNPYVEESKRYKADSVKVELDEATFTVTVVPVDVFGVALAGVSMIVNKTCVDLPSGIKYYEFIIQQLEQGDVIRNI
jgi:hypothetical protein